MTKHFNKLSPRDHEILSKLAEESSECIQTICKILIHGFDSHEPGLKYPDNRQKFELELGDFLAFCKIAFKYGLIDQDRVRSAMQARMKRQNHYLHHTKV